MGFILFSISCFLTFINDYIYKITIFENETKIDSVIIFLSISTLLLVPISILTSKVYAQNIVESITAEDIEKIHLLEQLHLVINKLLKLKK